MIKAKLCIYSFMINLKNTKLRIFNKNNIGKVENRLELSQK